MSQSIAHREPFVDNLVEDEADKENLLVKPTCFLIVGRPGVGKSTLARKIAESWKCILIDDTDLLNTHIKNKTKQGIELLNILSEGKSIPDDMVLRLILARLNSPDVEHYGYVLSCLPFMSEDHMTIQEQIKMIKNLKLPPDFIINIQYADKDLVQRLSGLKQNPETGQLYSRDQWQKESKDEEVEEPEEQAEEEEPVDSMDQLVWTPDNSVSNAFTRINTYREIMLIPLEDYMIALNPLNLLELDGSNTPEKLHLCVMNHLGAMAIKRVAVPVILHQPDDEELPDDIDTDNLFRGMSLCKTVAPGFRWRRSRWGQTCPVALKEGKVVPGKPELCVGFQDKLYVLSSQEASQRFITNPRPYLLPPMPRPPCRAAIIGPPLTGKTTLCQLMAQHYNALVLDMDELVQPLLGNFEQDRLNKIREETTQAAIEKVKMKMEQDGEQDPAKETNTEEVTESHPEVQALVFAAVEEAKHMGTSPLSLYAEALDRRIKEIEEADADADIKTGWVLDNFPKNLSQMEALQQAGILPEMLFCLTDTDRNQILKRMYEMNKESVDKAVRDRLQDEQLQNDNKALNQMEQESEVEAQLGELQTNQGTKEVLLPDHWELGYPEGPEMNESKQQLQQFETDSGRMLSSLPIEFLQIEIDGKRPEDLLQEVVFKMESPFKYTSWEMSIMDQEEEEEDMEAIAEQERSEEDSGINDAAEEEEQSYATARRTLGDTHHFCPVALRKQNVLLPCSDEIAAKYREKTFLFSSTEARDSFIQNPEQFVAQTGPLQPPPLRILMLGTRGSGKTTQGKWLAEQLGIFHVQFRELLQALIIAKTKKPVPYADELQSPEESPEDLDALIKEARREAGKDPEVAPADEEEMPLTDEEKAIEAYLSDGDPLSPQILDTVVKPFWKEEPYMSTGFILEGFPHHLEEVQYMLQRQLYPDLVAVMEVDAFDVNLRLLPTLLQNWREQRDRREAQLTLLRDLRKKNQEESIAKRRAELMAERGSKEAVTYDEGDEEDDSADNADDIEAILNDEFGSEEEKEDTETQESEEAASERLEMEIEGRFNTDRDNLLNVIDLLVDENIPKVTITASRKPSSVRHQLLQRIQPLITNRESLFQKCQPISSALAQKLLLSSYKHHSAFGCWDPIKQYENRDLIQPLLWPPNTAYPVIFHQYIYYFASKENRNTFMQNPLKYLRQPKPPMPLPVKIAVIGPPKSGKTTVAQMLEKKYGLARLTIGVAVRHVLSTQEHTDLAIQLKKLLSLGHVVPDELASQCLKVVLLSSVCKTRGFVLDGFPMTLKQAELMESLSVVPMVVAELELDLEEVLKRGQVDKIKPKPHLKHDSPEILHIRYSCYQQEVGRVRQHFQRQYHNWLLLDGLKNQWWIWSTIIREVSISMKCIHSYLERTDNGQAACINRSCLTPKEMQRSLGEFGYYCPVCLALQRHLVDCSETVALTHMAEHRSRIYKMCGQDHLEMFLSTPDQFVSPGCPHTLPDPHLLPKKVTVRFPQAVEMKGFCPVTYLDGKQRYEALVRGQMEYAAEYRERIYIFETEQKRDTFLRSPEIYWDQELPSKVPPLVEPVPLTSLPTLGYLEQGVGISIIKAMTAVGCLKPKYPFLSLKRSALLYVAYYLNAFNQKSSECAREQYKKKLASFEENCALIPYLSSTMRGRYKPPSERPFDFDFKMNRFLSLGEETQK